MSEDRVFAKCAWRIIPLMALLLFINFVDRTNVGFAALTMNRDLGFSPTIFGFGAGLFFVGDALCQVPANLILERIGAKRWMFFILAAWGLLSASNALVRTPGVFYAVRFFLGAAEAGMLPGILLYLTYWFPRNQLSRFTANFGLAIPLSFIIGGPFSSVILGMEGVAGLHGWQWLFLIEGMPAFLISFAVLKLLPDGPAGASWLTPDEKTVVIARVARDAPTGRPDLRAAFCDPCVIALGFAHLMIRFAYFSLVLWLPQIVQAMGISNRMTGFVVALPFVAGAGAMILCGDSSAKLRERILHIALPWLAGAFGFGVAAVTHSNTLMLAALALSVIGLQAHYGPFYSLPSSFLRGTAAAGGIALFNSIRALGGFLGPTLQGVLKQGSGDYSSGFAAAGLALFMAALIVLAVGRVSTARVSPTPGKPVSA